MVDDLRSLWKIHQITREIDEKDPDRFLRIPQMKDTENWMELTYLPFILSSKDMSEVLKKIGNLKISTLDSDRKTVKEKIFERLKEHYEKGKLVPSISYIPFKNAKKSSFTPVKNHFSIIGVWKTMEKHGSYQEIRPTGFSYENKDDQVFIDFANKRFGGSILGGGWVQEEASIAGMSIFPYINDLRNALENDIGDNPTIIETNVYFSPAEKISSGEKLVNKWNERGTHVDLGWVFDKQPGTKIFWLTMVAFALYENEKIPPLTKFKRMNERVHQAFEFAIRYLISKGIKEIVINTGNWGAGAFKWSKKVVYEMQTKVFRYLKMRFALLFPNISIKLVYFSFNKNDRNEIQTIRDNWGYDVKMEESPSDYWHKRGSRGKTFKKKEEESKAPIGYEQPDLTSGTDPRGHELHRKQWVLQNTIFFNVGKKLYQYYASGDYAIVEIDDSEFNFLSIYHRTPNPHSFSLGKLLGLRGLNSTYIHVHYIYTLLLFYLHINIQFGNEQTYDENTDYSKRFESFEEMDKRGNLKEMKGNTSRMDKEGIVQVIVQAFRQKFSTEPYRGKLLRTSDMILVDRSDEIVDSTLNLSGQILMQIRREKRIEENLGVGNNDEYLFEGEIYIFKDAGEYFSANSVESFKESPGKKTVFPDNYYIFKLDNTGSSDDTSEILLTELTLQFGKIYGELLYLIATRRMSMCTKLVYKSTISSLSEKLKKHLNEVKSLVVSNGKFIRLKNMYVAYLVSKLINDRKNRELLLNTLFSYYNVNDSKYYNFVDDPSLNVFNE